MTAHAHDTIPQVTQLGLPAAAFTGGGADDRVGVAEVDRCLWLIRKAFKLTWWLLLAVAAIAAWPVTVVTAAGYTAAWLRGWPPVRLYRAAAWSLPVTAAWLADLEIRAPGFLAARDARPDLGGRLGPA